MMAGVGSQQGWFLLAPARQWHVWGTFVEPASSRHQDQMRDSIVHSVDRAHPDSTRNVEHLGGLAMKKCWVVLLVVTLLAVAVPAHADGIIIPEPPPPDQPAWRGSR